MTNLARIIFRLDVSTALFGIVLVFAMIAAGPPPAPTEEKVSCKTIEVTNESDDGLDVFICKKV